LWDAETGEKVKKFKGHSSHINACDSANKSSFLFTTASDDGTIKVRKKLFLYIYLKLLPIFKIN